MSSLYVSVLYFAKAFPSSTAVADVIEVWLLFPKKWHSNKNIELWNTYKEVEAFFFLSGQVKWKKITMSSKLFNNDNKVPTNESTLYQPRVKETLQEKYIHS